MTPHNQSAINGLEPVSVWRIFAELASVPRPSKHEAAIQDFVKRWAEERGLKVTHEPVGNIIIHVPATSGHETAPVIALQGHLDMVAEKNAGTKHDFLKDPIRLVRATDPRSGAEIVRADGTTLGADNGMGVALALAAATEKDLVHGPLEILLTCDEEAGMTGAKAVTPQTIRARTLINLDSEEDDALYIGCAGGADTTISWTLSTSSTQSSSTSQYSLAIRGLTGGHSGCDIHLNRGNAIKLLANCLANGLPELQLSSIKGGSKRNAIPREAEATFAATPASLQRIRAAAEQLQQQARRAGESDCEIVLAAANAEASHVMSSQGAPSQGASSQGMSSQGSAGILPAQTAFAAPALITPEDTERILHTLIALPSGVLAVVPDIPGLVQTSSNLSTIESHPGGAGILPANLAIQIGCLSRSSSMDELLATVRQIKAIARLAGGKVEEGDSYPGWQPNPDSPLLGLCKTVYRDCFGNDPQVRAIHAGLECGIIGEALGGNIDMISFGPTIQGAHSPDERVYVDSVAKIWRYLKAVVAQLA